MLSFALFTRLLWSLDFVGGNGLRPAYFYYALHTCEPEQELRTGTRLEGVPFLCFCFRKFPGLTDIQTDLITIVLITHTTGVSLWRNIIANTGSFSKSSTALHYRKLNWQDEFLWPWHFFKRHISGTSCEQSCLQWSLDCYTFVYHPTLQEPNWKPCRASEIVSNSLKLRKHSRHFLTSPH